MHPLYHLAHKLVIALVLGFFTSYPKLTYVIAGISAIYAIYILVLRPYKTSLLQIRAFINETAIVFIAGTAVYYQNYTDDIVINKTQYLAWL
jgi:hypothetical protein